MNITGILPTLGLQIDIGLLLAICGLIEVFKKAFDVKIKDKNLYILFAMILSIGASFLIVPLTVTSVIVNSVMYFILATLCYDAAIAPLKKWGGLSS